MTGTGPITKDMLIGEAIQKYPHTAEMLMESGVHCVGCGGAYMETIEQGLKGHGMTDEEVDKMVVALNNNIPEEHGNDDLAATKPALEKVREFMRQQQVKPGAGLRIRVESGGCSGYQYAMLFDMPATNDHVTEIEGVRFIMDEESYAQLKGIKLDYIDGLQGSGFKISNPNADHTCGCGQSFH